MVLKEANLAESLELLSLRVEEGQLEQGVEEGEVGREVLEGVEASYKESVKQVREFGSSRLYLYLQMRNLLEKKRKYLSSCKISL